ncbi:hypothetical protein [Croceivirga thetidis]|uniref:Pectate lyase superfamily protein domain-containing protein n=1 Tax=Croceivirga thetidis TaxID=2721623 RepID=A0ABX1GTH5_9FLAO|nr:hypothetical protein [Croceivirga thetidis]NKI32022.1 hypothetical protein [Croceivirga thetidis]
MQETKDTLSCEIAIQNMMLRHVDISKYKNLKKINLAHFGVVGNGKVDDTEALQRALDSGKELYADEGSTFLISKLLVIDNQGDQSIHWNNSTIITNSYLEQAFHIKKESGLLEMSNLTIEGNYLIGIGFWIHSVVNFSNVDVRELSSRGMAAYAFRYEVTEHPNSHGDATFDNCDCKDIDTASNGIIGDSKGASRCLIFRYGYSGPSTKISWTNSVFDGAWGDDGDLVHFEQMVSDINDSKFVFENMELKNFSRRAVKGLTGGVQFRNTRFKSPSSNNKKLSSAIESAGLVAMGNMIQNEAAKGVKFIGCTFDNSEGYEGRLIINRQDNLEIKNCTFIRTDIAFYQDLIGDILICKNRFDGRSRIYEYGFESDEPYFGVIKIGGNKGLNGLIDLELGKIESIECAQ